MNAVSQYNLHIKVGSLSTRLHWSNFLYLRNFVIRNHRLGRRAEPVIAKFFSPD